MLNKVKLANGTEIDWEEFSKWSPQKQHMSLLPSRLGANISNEERKNRSNAQKLRHLKTPTSDETKRKLKEANSNRKRTSEQKENLKKGWEKLKASGWVSKQKGKSVPSQWKSIVTPNGIFPSNKALAERICKDMNLSSISYAKSKINYWLKKYPNHYYYEEDKAKKD